MIRDWILHDIERIGGAGKRAPTVLAETKSGGGLA